MVAPKGNQFWKLRSKHGRDKLFATPDLLWDAACEYFEWCDSHPWVVTKNKSRGRVKEKEESPTQCPYSITGLMGHLDVSKSFWIEFKKAANEDFLWVITRIENIIETQQLEGAIVGVFNSNIVARINGLVDKKENTVKGSVFTPMTIDEAKSIINEL